MKKIPLMFLLLAFVTALAGCSQSATEAPGTTEAPAAGKTHISILRPGDQEKVESFMKPALEQFMQENPDIEVEAVYESWGGWIQKYPTLFDSDTQPDVIFWWDNKQNDASAADKLVRLNDYLSPELIAKIPQTAWDMVSIGDGDIYYVPSTTDVFVIMYNKDVFTAAGLDPEAPPTTWDELLAASKAIDENTDVPAIGVPAKTGTDALQEFITTFVVAKTGQDMVNADNQATFDTPEGLEAMQFISELFQYAQPSATEFTRGDLRPMLRDGQIGMIFESAWAIPTFQEAYGEDLDASPIGFAQMPVAAPGSPKAVWMGTNGWIATREETAEASAKLINYMMSDEVLFQHHVAYGSIPMFEYELEQDFYNYDFWKLMYDEVNTYDLYGMIGKYSTTPAAFYTELEEVWQLLLIDRIDAQTAIDMAVEKIDAINARQQ
ncbi:MAG: extracellular solute-binding protein [Caldilineaceae bacterium]|nr:extracellular solute-binding protein [Caldilineaceae bacterium]